MPSPITLPLQDNVVYRNGDNREVWIAGATKHYPEYVWSYDGDWYERATGRFVHSHDDGERFTRANNWRNLTQHC